MAIYGIQGANGVVIVTTKRGHGKATISYDGFYGSQQPLANGFNLSGSQTYADVLWLQSYNAGLIPGNTWFGQGGATYAPPTLPAYLTPTPYSNATGTVNPNYVALQDPSTYNIPNNQITKTHLVGTDWFHEIFKPAPWTQHTLSASAATEKSSYYCIFLLSGPTGNPDRYLFKRYSCVLILYFNVKDHIRIGENAYVFLRQNP